MQKFEWKKPLNCYTEWKKQTIVALWVEKTEKILNKKMFQNVVTIKQSFMLTCVRNSQWYPVVMNEIQYFYPHSLQNCIPRFALLRLAALGLRNLLRSVYHSRACGGQKTKFHPRLNWSHSFLYILLNKEPLFTEVTLLKQSYFMAGL